MTKTKEELQQLKVEYETLNNKLQELTSEELKIVTGGTQYHAYDITFYVGENGAVKGPDIQVGNYFTSVEYQGSGSIEVYRLESKVNKTDSVGIATKFSSYKNNFPNYTNETNVPIYLAGMARIHKPNWIK